MKQSTCECLNAKLEDTRKELRRRDCHGYCEICEREKYALTVSRCAEKLLLSQTVPATNVDYSAWLYGYLAKEGIVTHSYDYPIGRTMDFVVATNGTYIPALYGSASKNIIVPKGIDVFCDKIGHNNIYCMDRFTHHGNFVPIFSDTRFTCLPVKQRRPGFAAKWLHL